MPFKSLNLNSKSRNITGVINFSGVDYATQRFKASQNKAIDILNFIYKDGVIQKRQGIEELFALNPTYYIPIDVEPTTYKVNDLNFNGIWTIKGEDNKLHVVAHIGKLLYELKENNEVVLITTSSKTEALNGNIYYEAYEFENYKSSAFVADNKLYFLGGNKFMCIRFLSQDRVDIYPIEDHSETYIPTTTTSITYKDSAISGRASLDKVNLLTQWRKNELMSGTLKNENEKTKTNFYEYTLDSPLITKEEQDMSNILIILEERGTIE